MISYPLSMVITNCHIVYTTNTSHHNFLHSTKTTNTRSDHFCSEICLCQDFEATFTLLSFTSKARSGVKTDQWRIYIDKFWMQPPSRPNFLHISCSFWKILPNNRLAPPSFSTMARKKTSTSYIWMNFKKSHDITCNFNGVSNNST